MGQEKKRPGKSDFFQDTFHAKRNNDVPKILPAIKEYAPTLIVIGAAFFVSIVLYLFGAFSSGSSVQPPTDPLFQARIVFPVGVVKVYAPGSDKNVIKLEARVKNIGQSEALNVWVDVEVDGVTAELPGPLSIGAGEEATYSVEGSFVFSPTSTFRLKSSCWNCPHTPGSAPDPGTINSWKARQLLIHGRTVQ